MRNCTYHFSVLIICLGFLLSCSSNLQLSKSSGNNPNQRLTEPPEEESYNKCFSIENGYSDFVYTDTLITKTEKGNFFKKISISDSLYIWKCGRGKIEHTIDTLYCSKSTQMSLEWESTEFVTLIEPCGSGCWTNIVFPVSSDMPILYLSYSAIDMDNMNVLSIADSSFIVQNLKNHKQCEVPISKFECLDGYPLFSIHNIQINGSKISYTIDCKDGVSYPIEFEISESSFIKLK